MLSISAFICVVYLTAILLVSMVNVRFDFALWDFTTVSVKLHAFYI